MINLNRIKYTDKSTIGELYINDVFQCYTLENTWMDNIKRLSCIPIGCYKLITKTYGRFYKQYNHPIIMLNDVPNRSEILIHRGNYPKDTLGCILLGDTIGEDYIGNSRNTYNKIYPIIINQIVDGDTYIDITEDIID